MFTKEQALKEINETQDRYVRELYNLLKSVEYSTLKQINFTSPTGTGKTRMISKLMNICPPRILFYNNNTI